MATRLLTPPVENAPILTRNAREAIARVLRHPKGRAIGYANLLADVARKQPRNKRPWADYPEIAIKAAKAGVPRHVVMAPVRELERELDAIYETQVPPILDALEEETNSNYTLEQQQFRVVRELTESALCDAIEGGEQQIAATMGFVNACRRELSHIERRRVS